MPMPLSLLVRPCVRGPDDELRVDIINRAYASLEGFLPLTVEEVRRWAVSPQEQRRNRFIAELDEAPAGTVASRVDPDRAEQKGFVEELCVVPELRRRGVGTALVEAALADLRSRGAAVAEAREADRAETNAFLGSLGFKVTRSFSEMLRPLDNIPEPPEVPGLRLPLVEPSEENIAAAVRLRNEAFSHHYNYRPLTVEEIRFAERAAVERGAISLTYFAYVEETVVGYAWFGFDPRRNKQFGRRRGSLRDIGVLPGYRRRGIARALIVAVLRRLKADGMTDTRLYVDDLNQTGARELYERLDFTVILRDLVHTRSLTEPAGS
jgi:mycothiol synthase